MKKVFEIFLYAVAISVFMTFCYGAYLLERKINWNLMYDGKTVDTICQMVKPEYLINVEDCE